MQKNKKLNSDLDTLRAMTDDDIDYSDLPPLTEECLSNIKGFAEFPENCCKNSTRRQTESLSASVHV
jgi:hypothetical protein